jgi:hypothetical protein
MWAIREKGNFGRAGRKAVSLYIAKIYLKKSAEKSAKKQCEKLREKAKNCEKTENSGAVFKWL